MSRDDDEFGHEDTLAAVLLQLLAGDGADLEDPCEDAGIPMLTNAEGQPVYITRAATYHDAGVITHDRGVVIELSDGSQFSFTATLGRRPHP